MFIESDFRSQMAERANALFLAEFSSGYSERQFADSNLSVIQKKRPSELHRIESVAR